MSPPKSSHRLTDFILYSGKHRAIWRPVPNPDDPYIYVSFSLQQFKETYGNEPAVKRGILGLHEILNVPEKKQKQLVGIIESEIINRAGFPVKFLPADAKDIKNLNVCFIIQRITDESAVTDGKVSVSTLHMRENENIRDNITPSQYKIVILDNLNSDLTAQGIYTFLHEFLHVLEFKHFFKHQDMMEVGPFTIDLTCLDTIMALAEFCPPVQEAEERIFGSRTVSIFSTDPKDRADIRDYENSYPRILGPLDLEAAKVFIARWQERNQAPKPIDYSQPDISASEGVVPRSDLFSISTCLGNCVKAVENFAYEIVDGIFTNITNVAISYSEKLVKECPSYYSAQKWDYLDDATTRIPDFSLHATTPTTPISAPSLSTISSALNLHP